MTVSEIAQQDTVIQLLCLICVVEILISQCFQLKITHNKNAKGPILALMTGVFHNAIFYIVLNLDRFTFLDIKPLFGSYTIWSSVRIFHIFFVMAIIEYMRGQIAYDFWKTSHPEGLLIYIKNRITNRGIHD